MWDASGHAVGILAPGGFVVSTDPDGKSWDVWTAGYRNAYDIAFNADGDLFVYDSDMEWDFGTPWYKPTRVNHATSGSELGWRSGSGNWPARFPDCLPALVDIGPGSPVGVAFGYGEGAGEVSKGGSTSATGPSARSTRFTSNPKARVTRPSRRSFSREPRCRSPT